MCRVNLGLDKLKKILYCLHLHIIFAFLHSIHLSNAQQGGQNLMGLISTRDIAELTQMATELAAQTMQNNGKLMSKSGAPEVRSLSIDARPSELFSQSLTNLMQPARQHLAKVLQQPAASFLGSSNAEKIPRAMHRDQASQTEQAEKPQLSGGGGFNQLSNFLGSRNQGYSAGGSGSFSGMNTAGDTLLKLADSFLGSGTNSNNANEYEENAGSTRDGNSGIGGMNQAVARLFNSGIRTAKNDFGSSSSVMDSNGGRATSNSNNRMGGLMPQLRQFFPGADRNFGVQQGEGCLPFIGEFMKAIYGNCVRQADEKTWDTWGKEISNALMGGKIDLLRASKETCKKGAEREQCGQLRKAVSDCDILGSIQLASSLQRSVSRCDEVSGIIDQNPQTIMSQMNGLINGEMAQGLLNNFLG